MNENVIAGVDEAGRGALAGPVVAAAVIFDSPPDIEGLTDSKQLSAKMRQMLDAEIKKKCACWTVGIASPAEVDRINVLQATLVAMKRAIESLAIRPTQVLVDGTHLPELNCPGEAIPKGDLKEPVISAASVIAKVARDSMMEYYSIAFPDYGFEHNAGYGTKLHLESLSKYGVTSIHRKTFAPVSRLEQTEIEL